MFTRVVLVFLLGLPVQAFVLRAGAAPPEIEQADSTGAGVWAKDTSVGVKPDAYYLRDKNGNLVLVPDFSFEELERLIRLDQRLNHPQPRPYTLQSIVIDGFASRKEARLNVEFQILLHRTGWVRVPLRLNKAVLRTPPRGEGPDAVCTEYEKDGDGYVCWLRGEEDKPHVLSMEFICPVAQLGEESRLPLSIPLAASSQLKMVVDVPEASATVNEEANLLAPRRLPDGRTEFTAVGLEGEFQLAWRSGPAESARAPTVLEADGVVLVNVEEGRRISCDVQLDVRSFGGAIDSFLVRLPRGMQLLPLPQSGYQVSVANRDNVDAPLVEVQLDRETARAAKVRFLTESTELIGAEPSPVEVAGFEVLGAIRQRGRIDVAVEGDWTVHWETDANIQRRDETPEELDRQGVIARFDYFHQPCRLQLDVTPRERHIRVEPAYRVLVGPRNVRLIASLKYRIRGAGADRVQVNLAGWEIDRVLPERFVDVDRLDLTDVAPLSIPLAPSARVSPGDFELTIQAHQDLPDQANGVAFTLPQPTARALAHASVAIQPADDVDLTPRPEAMEGLIEDLSPPQRDWSVEGSKQAPLFYLDADDSDPARFVADFLVRQRILLAALSGRLRLAENQVQVEQRIAYRIAYESVASLVLDIPQTALASGDLTVLLDDAPLPLSQLPAPGGEAATRTQWKVNLGQARIGSFELVIRYTAAMPPLQPREDIDVAFPLVLPSAADGAAVVGNSLEVSFDNSLRVKPAGGGWTASGSAGSGGSQGGPLDLTAQVAADRVPLTVTLAEPRRSERVRVPQAWLQTWFGPEGRRDRAAYRILTREKELRVQLPADARWDGIVAAWDGEAIEAPNVSEEGVLRIEAGPAAPRQEHVLELWYDAASGVTANRRLAIAPPSVAGADRVDRFYWQLVTPANVHLLRGPSGLTSDVRWEWRGWYWGRQAKLGQSDLEKWIGATRQDPPPAGTNQYVFTSFDQPGPFSVLTAGRPAILLAASGVALLVGLLLLYISALRRPGVLLVPVILLVAGAFLFPEPSILIAQGASLGLALVLAARFLESVLAKRRFRYATVRGHAYSGADSQSRERVPTQFDAPPPATTATSPGPARLPAAGSES